MNQYRQFSPWNRCSAANSNITCGRCRKLITALAMTLVAVISSGQLIAGIITNGDFEAGNFTGWTTIGNVDVVSETLYHTGAFFVGSFPSGHFAVSFGDSNGSDDGALFQSFATAVGKEYKLSFEYGSATNVRFPPPPQSIAITATNVATNSLLLNTTLTDSTSSDNLGTILSPYTFTFTATGLLTRIGFRDTSVDSFAIDGILDNVQVETAVAAVPEPGGLALVGLGTLGLRGIVRLRRRAIAQLC